MSIAFGHADLNLDYANYKLETTSPTNAALSMNATPEKPADGSAPTELAMGDVLELGMLRQMQQAQQPRRRSSSWVVVLVVLLMLAVGVALFLVLRRRGGFAKVPQDPPTITPPKDKYVTADMLTNNKIEGLRMAGWLQNLPLPWNTVAASVGATGPGVVSGSISTMKMESAARPISFTWTPEEPPKGTNAPSAMPPKAKKFFIPGTLSMSYGSGSKAATLYLAPDTATGRVGWTVDKTYVGLVPWGEVQAKPSKGKSWNMYPFTLALLSSGDTEPTYAIPQSPSDPWTLASVPWKTPSVSF